MAGVLVGMTPSVGFQILPAIFIASLIKGNRILAVLLTLVSNPFTVVPLYATFFFIGKALLPDFTNVSFHKVEDLVVNFAFDKLFSLGYETIVVLWVGGIVLCIPSAVIAYYLFLYLATTFRKKQEEQSHRKRQLHIQVAEGTISPDKDSNSKNQS